MSRIVAILVQILLFIPRLILRLVRGRRTPPPEKAPPAEEKAQPAEPEPPTEAVSKEERQPQTAETEEE